MQRTIPQILKKIRLDKGFSQENLAEEIKVDATTYGRYESGDSQIKFEQVAKIAKFYELTLDEFYHYGEPNYNNAVFEPNPVYKTRQKVIVSVELDGLESTLNDWVNRLTKINSVLS